MRQIEQRPWTGYGYAAVWDDGSAWAPLAWIVKEAGFKASHAHNAWLEQWLGLGIGGLAAWGLFWLQTMGAAVVAVFRERGAYLAFPFLVVYSLTSLTESIAVSYNDMRWVIFVCFAVKLAQRPARRAPSAAVTISKPLASALSISRSSAPGVQPHGDGLSATSCV
jgi:exopolysaccharide production protein ExoQ